jgi:hypothetical protein
MGASCSPLAAKVWLGPEQHAMPQNASAGEKIPPAQPLERFAGSETGRRSAAAAARTAAARTHAELRLRLQRLRRDQAFALGALARQLAGAADGFRLLAGAPFGGLFVVAAQFHFAKDALALHLLFQGFEGLVDVIVANENLHVIHLLEWLLELGTG